MTLEYGTVEAQRAVIEEIAKTTNSCTAKKDCGSCPLLRARAQKLEAEIAAYGTGGPYRTPAEVPLEPAPIPPPASVPPPESKPFFAARTMSRAELEILLDSKIAAARAFADKIRNGKPIVRVRAEEIAVLHDVICELAELCKTIGAEEKK